MTSLIRNGRIVALAALFVMWAAGPAAADWRLTPYTGVQFGGAANTLDVAELEETFEPRFNIGAALAWTTGGVVGFEIDYSYTPNLFQLTDSGRPYTEVDINSSVTTFMGNAVFSFPSGGNVSAYAVGGAGLMRATFDIEDLELGLNTNELGVNVGGGAHVFFNDHVGLRGDARYFRALQNDGDGLNDRILDDELGLKDYDFWRATFGVTFRFGY